MKLPPLQAEDRWTIICCGLIAHADEIVEMGEWDAVMRMVPGSLAREQRNRWLAVLSDQEQLEQEFEALTEVPEGFAKQLLWRSWQVALADGAGSDVEESQHDRVAVRVGVTLEEVAAWRQTWTAEAATYARAAVGLASVFVNLDGRLDFHEAVHFENLLERMPVSLAERADLSAILMTPPTAEQVIEELSGLPESQRLAAFHELVPLVRTSRRAEREQEEFFILAQRVGIARAAVERLLED